MFELFKDSKYEGYIGDTFKFIKLYGLHLIKNYLIFNSLFLVAASFFSFYYKANPTFIFSFGFFTLIFFLLVFGILNFAFIPIYFRLILEKGGANFGLKELIKEFKKAIGKTIKYSLYLLMWTVPFIIAIFISFITIIGIPAVFLFFPFFILWTIMAYHYYLNEESVSVFKILGPNYRLLKKQFWPTLGTTMLFLFLSQFSSVIISSIPKVIYYFTSVTSSEGGNSFFIAMTGEQNIFVTFFTTIISNVFSLLIAISSGIIYYSLRNKEWSVSAEIDQLGN